MSQRERARHYAKEAAESSAGASRLLLAFLIAPLPERWRAGLEDRLGLNTDPMAFPSALAQWVLFFAAWALGMKAWMHGLTSGLEGPLDNEKDMYSFALLWMNPTLPIVYSFISPIGFFTMLGTAGGMIRLLYAAAHRRNAADPWLYLIDKGWTLWTGKRAEQARERSKGSASPDRIVHGAGGDPAALHLTSCDDHPWPEGSTVRLFGLPYQLVERRDTQDAQGRLRNLYRFRLIEGAGVMRGMREYCPAQRPLVKGSPPPQAPPEEEAAPAERTPIPLSPDDPRPR